MALRRNRREAFNIWPGFVDALGNLLNVLVFVLFIFVLAQFFLGRTLSGRNDQLARLNHQIEEMAQLLNMERQTNHDLKGSIVQLSAQLAAANAQVESLTDAQRNYMNQLADLQSKTTAVETDNSAATTRLADLQNQVQALQALKADLEKQIQDKDKQLNDTTGKLKDEQNISEQARAQLSLVNAQLAALQHELARLNDALGAADKVNQDDQAQIADLGKQLNRALATKVAELQKYRSEFFGKLRQVLGDRPDIKIVGDRFVFQSEVLFPTGSADLTPQGQMQVTDLAKTLISIAATVPPDIDWVLRVDGHTDRRPINTPQFKSNWDLSTARAVSVLKALVAEGVPPNRLAAAGFGEFQPVDNGTTEEAYSHNRRIELKFDQR